MTKSSRRMDAIAGRSKWSTTDKKCEECNGKMVKLRANVYVCTKCGLEQYREVKGKSSKSYSYPKYSQRIEKQWEEKNALTHIINDKSKNHKTEHIKHNKSKYIKPNQAKIRSFKCSKCNKRFKT